MSDLFTKYTPIRGSYPHTYFAGANTADGFIGAYPAFINERALDRLYILKGGSGTGKSTLIKTCAARAEEAGAEVTLLLCSSDPSSADAIILRGKNGRRIAVLDGTAPHTLDPALPGAVGRLVNAGVYWDSDVLHDSREQIAELCSAKASAYARAYRFLGAYRHITAVQRQFLTDCIRHDKLQSAAQRLAASIPTDKLGTEETVYTYALSMTGACHLTTFTDLAAREFRITDHYGSGEFFLSALRQILRDKKNSLVCAPSPPCPDMLSELYLPSANAAVTLGNERGGDGITNINMQRFLDKAQLSLCRSRIRFAEKCREEMLDGALQALADAAACHFALEEIYKSAMDFDALAAERIRIAEEIAAELR